MPDNAENWLNPLSSAQSFLSLTNQVSLPGACVRLLCSRLRPAPQRGSRRARPCRARGSLELPSCRQVHPWVSVCLPEGKGKPAEGGQGCP